MLYIWVGVGVCRRISEHCPVDVVMLMVIATDVEANYSMVVEERRKANRSRLLLSIFIRAEQEVGARIPTPQPAVVIPFTFQVGMTMLVRGNSGSALPSTAGLSLQSPALLFLFQIPPPSPAFVTASSQDPLAFRSHHLEATALVWISGGRG